MIRAKDGSVFWTKASTVRLLSIALAKGGMARLMAS